MKGDKTTVLVDREGGTHPLNRYLNQLKKAGQIQSIDKFDLVNNWNLDKLEPGHTTERKTQRTRKNKQTEKALDTITGKAEQVPGIRQKTEWQRWREAVLTDAYGEALAKELERENVLVQKRTYNRTITITSKDKEARIFDTGERVNSDKGTDKEIQLMLKVAKAKGWKELDLTGSDDFRARAAEAAIKAGFTLINKDLEANAIDKIAKDKAIAEEVKTTLAPTLAPTQAPTQAPTLAPTQAPTLAPTQAPITLLQIKDIQAKAKISHVVTGLETQYESYNQKLTAQRNVDLKTAEAQELADKNLDAEAIKLAELYIKDQNKSLPDNLKKLEKVARQENIDSFNSDKLLKEAERDFEKAYIEAAGSSNIGQLGAEPRQLKREFEMHLQQNQELNHRSTSTFEKLVDAIKDQTIEKVEELPTLIKQRESIAEEVASKQQGLLYAAQSVNLQSIVDIMAAKLEKQHTKGFEIA
jgi:hypothetical protein